LSNLLIVEIVAGTIMKRFIEGETRTQVTLLPECLDDYVAEENPVRVVDVFVDELDLGALGFEGVGSCCNGASGLPSSDLAEDLYLRLPQSDSVFRKDNGKAIRSVCR
jgi:hypothetical protein